MTYKYGDFTSNQISKTKEKMRKQIFFLLLIVDPTTAEEYENVDVRDAFQNVLSTFGGLNDLLGYPQEFVTVMSQLNAALLEAGNTVLKIKEVEDADP